MLATMNSRIQVDKIIRMDETVSIPFRYHQNTKRNPRCARPLIYLFCDADFMPATLAFSGWMPAIWSGLIMLCIGIATSGDVNKKLMRQEQTTAAI